MAAPDIRKVVRVMGTRNGLIEFEYGVGDLSLALELMLPPAAFEDFCRVNAVEVLSEAPEEILDEAARAMAWRPSDVQRAI
jgi:phenol/toluene 2-monooxygenase (NADH) P0/A0